MKISKARDEDIYLIIHDVVPQYEMPVRRT